MTLLRVLPSDEKHRLDHFLARHYPDCTRSYLAKLIQAAQVTVNGSQVKAGYKLHVGESVQILFPPAEKSDLTPEPVSFDCLHEDEHLLIINKPPGLVVHPAAGNTSGTLVHGLLYKYRNLPQLEGGRPGIVHRLDKDTSGIMLIAKTEPVLHKLAQAFHDRLVQKTYQAVLLRTPPENSGRIDAPIGRHPVNRKKMAVRSQGGRYAVSNWTIRERFAGGFCLAEIGIETGRTHQIRVHMASIQAPVAGDVLYGGKTGAGSFIQPQRQMLHAWSLRFNHPVSGEHMHWQAPLWKDMEECVALLREASS